MGDAIEEAPLDSAFGDALAREDYASGDMPSATRGRGKDKIVGTYVPLRRTSNRSTPPEGSTPSAEITPPADTARAEITHRNGRHAFGGALRRRSRLGHRKEVAAGANSTFEHASVRNGEA